MADFSLRTLIVVPESNTFPTSGSTENLAAGQVGVFKDDARTAATAGNISTASYIQIAQGRPGSYLGTKISDKIVASKVKKYYVVTGSDVAANEIWEFSDFDAGCDEDITFTLRGHSKYLDTIDWNGFTRSVTVRTPCCDCGADPCTDVANETLIDLILAAIAAPSSVQNSPNSLTMSTFWTFTKVGTGDSAVLQVQGKPITSYGKFCNVAINPFELDRIYFKGWVYKNPDVSVDFIVYDRCEQAATATITQRSTFVRGTSDEIYQHEIDYYSYQSDFKHLFQQSQYNQKFEDYVVDGVLYDQLYLIFDSRDQDQSWSPSIKIDETIMLAIPQAQTDDLTDILVPYLGEPVDESGIVGTTTSTTSSTTSTSTTSTTTFIP